VLLSFFEKIMNSAAAAAAAAAAKRLVKTGWPERPRRMQRASLVDDVAKKTK
jgi:hypothetical protein